MHLDIRRPIGLLFTLIGVLLVLQGLSGAAAPQNAAAGVNINLAWGAVMVVFGVVMLLLARRRR